MLLGWDQVKLASAADISPVTIKRIEAAGGPAKTTAKTEEKIRRALEAAGVLFIPDGKENGPGVRLARPYAKPHKSSNPQNSVRRSKLCVEK